MQQLHALLRTGGQQAPPVPQPIQHELKEFGVCKSCGQWMVKARACHCFVQFSVAALHPPRSTKYTPCASWLAGSRPFTISARREAGSFMSVARCVVKKDPPTQNVTVPASDMASIAERMRRAFFFSCVWCYRLVSGPGSPHKYDDPLHC